MPMSTLFFKAVLKATAVFAAVSVGFVESASASELPPAVALTPFGGLRLENEFILNRRIVGADGRGMRTLGIYECSGKFTAPNRAEGVCKLGAPGKAGFSAELVSSGPGEYVYTSKIQLPSGVDAGRLGFFMNFSLEKTRFIEIDGKVVAIPEHPEKHSLFSGRVDTLRFMIGSVGYVVTGPFKLTLLDQRKLRAGAAPRLVFSGTDSLRIARQEPRSTPIDIAAVANFGLADQLADDGRGGWLDQGSDNDLSGLPPGEGKFAGVDFCIIDPARNGGRAVISLSGSDSRLPKTATVKLPPQKKTLRYLHLLHASARGPAYGGKVGTLTVNYADGTSEKIVVRRGFECGETWSPSLSYPNAKLGFIQRHAHFNIGTFVSSFALNLKKTPVSVTFTVDKHAWGIAGISLGDWPAPSDAEPPYVVKPGKDWVALRQTLDIIPGSPLDFSGELDAPAGKYGRVVISSDGHFEFEKRPGERVRFVGTNIFQKALTPTHAEADKLVRRLAAEGFNTVRLHIPENQLLDRKAKDTLTFDADRLERFDYLVSRLKAAGFYLTTDIMGGRVIKPGDKIAEVDSGTSKVRKAMGAISPTALENWKAYARIFLTRKNAYTGLSIAEDPAFFFLVTENEGCILQWWQQCPKPVIAAYLEYLRGKGIYTPKLAEERAGNFFRFLVEAARRDQREKIRFLKEDLKLKTPLSSLNNLDYDPRAATLRDDYDLRDAHIYLNHPTFPVKRFSVPMESAQRSDVEDRFLRFGGIASSRILGRPLVSTEANWCTPGRYRVEGGPLLGALAGLQDYDALYSFGWTSRVENLNAVTPSSPFILAHDQLASLGWRTIGLLFRRGDVSRAEMVRSWTLTPKDEISRERLPESFRRLTGFCRIGLTGAKTGKSEEAPEAAVQKYLAALAKGRSAFSSTGELEFNPACRSMAVRTPRSECLTLETGAMTGRFMTVAGVDTFSTFALHAMDGKPLAESTRMLLFHLTDAANTGSSFNGVDRRLMLSYGTLPLLIKRGRAEITLRTPGLQVVGVAADGALKAPVAVRGENGVTKFTADIDGGDGDAVMCYLITRPAQNKSASH